jgi:hypothetical protein
MSGSVTSWAGWRIGAPQRPAHSRCAGGGTLGYSGRITVPLLDRNEIAGTISLVKTISGQAILVEVGGGSPTTRSPQDETMDAAGC